MTVVPSCVALPAVPVSAVTPVPRLVTVTVMVVATGIAAGAIYMRVETTRVPVARLAENIERQLKQRKAEATSALASMVATLSAELVDPAARPVGTPRKETCGLEIKGMLSPGG